MSQPPEDKKPDFSNFPRGAIGLKGLPVGRNARLPSIRTPRDLTLGAQPKRTFMPNIPVRREKKVDPTKSSDQSSSENSPKPNLKNVISKAERGRGRGKQKPQLIQLEGSVFGEGIAASARKVGRQREYIQRSEFSSGRIPHVKKEKLDFEMKGMEEEMKNLLRDDFIDDGDDSNSVEESVKPIIFPIKELKAKKEKIENDESFQNQDFAKGMNYDIQKIARFIKKEKTDEQIPIVKPDLSNVPENEITQLITNDNSPFFLLELPECITAEATDYQPHEQSVPESSKETKKNTTNLSSVPDGHIGKLQVLKSGRVRLKFGSLYYYLDVKCSLKTKHEIVSIKTDTNPGEIITLGNCETKLSIVPDMNCLIPCL